MKGTQDVLDALRAEGFRVSSAYLAWLLRDRWLESPEKAPGGAFVWTDADVQRLRSLLVRRRRGPVSFRPKGNDAGKGA